MEAYWKRQGVKQQKNNASARDPSKLHHSTKKTFLQDDMF